TGLPDCYEIQIDSGSHPNKTGTLYVLGAGKLEGNFIKETLVPPDTWFTQEVIARGNRIIVKVNDKVVTDYVDKKNSFMKGHLALQVFDPPTVVEFRQIKVKELSQLPVDDNGFLALFDGKDLSAWTLLNGAPANWRLAEDYVEA